jgi:hypothetical protein
LDLNQELPSRGETLKKIRDKFMPSEDVVLLHPPGKVKDKRFDPRALGSFQNKFKLLEWIPGLPFLLRFKKECDNSTLCSFMELGFVNIQDRYTIISNPENENNAKNQIP